MMLLAKAGSFVYTNPWMQNNLSTQKNRGHYA